MKAQYINIKILIVIKLSIICDILVIDSIICVYMCINNIYVGMCINNSCTIYCVIYIIN